MSGNHELKSTPFSWARDKSKMGSYSWSNRILGRMLGEYSGDQNEIEMVCRAKVDGGDGVFGIRQVPCSQK